MKSTKRGLSIILTLALLLTSVGIGLNSLTFEADVAKTAATPFSTSTFRRPAPNITLDVTDVTRVGAAGDTAYATGTTIKSATPSGVPYSTGTYASQSYSGETPTYPTIVFTSSAAVNITSITISGTGVTASATKTAGDLSNTTSATWQIQGGTATAGNLLKVAITYTYTWYNSYTAVNVTDTYTTNGYSYVESIIFPAGVWSWNNCYGTSSGNAAEASFVSRFLGRGVYGNTIGITTTSGDYQGGYTNVATNAWVATTDATMRTSLYSSPPHQGTGDKTMSNGTNPYGVSPGPDTHRAKATIYLDSSVQSLANNNFRIHYFIHRNIATGNQSLETVNQRLGDVTYAGGTGNVLGTGTANTQLGSDGPVDGTNSDAAAPYGQLQSVGNQTTTYFTGTGPAGLYTVVIQMTGKGKSSNWMQYYHGTTVEIIRFDKETLRSYLDIGIGTTTKTVTGSKYVTTIVTANGSDPANGGIANDNKGKNPQSWYYSAGWSNFSTYYDASWLQMQKPNTNQTAIGAAATNIATYYAPLTLSGANYTNSSSQNITTGLGNTFYGSSVAPLSTLVTAVQNHNTAYGAKLDRWTVGGNGYYTASSAAALNEAYTAATACQTAAYNVLYQPYVDYCAQQLKVAIDGLAYESYTVTFNGNGNTSGTMTAQTITAGATAKLTANTFARTGYGFAGWATSKANADAGTVAYNDNVNYTMGSSNANLYAVWTANTYALTFDAQSGSVTPTTSTVTYDSTYSNGTGGFPDAIRTGYTFGGWYTATGGGGTKIEGTDTVKITAPQTLYAKWTIIAYTITWNAGGGSGGTTTQVNYNVTPTPPSGITRTGYTLTGWSPTIVPATATATYTAQWAINSHKLTVDPNGGVWDTFITPKDYTQNYSTTKTINDPTRIGHTFAGWSLGAGQGSFVPGTGSGTYTFGPTLNANATLTAQWTPNQYTISFNSNGGNAVSPIIKDYNTTVPAPTPPTKTGHSFGGWYSDSGLNNAVSWNYTITADVTFYAKWTADKYTVTFNANGGGTPSQASTEVTYGLTYGTLATITCEGHQFNGWFTAPSGGTQVTAATTVAITANQTLYAQWTTFQYTVSFEPNGGSAVTSKTQDYGTQVTAPTAPTKTNYNFVAWYTDEALTTAVSWPYDLGAANVTFYAKWTMSQSAIDNITVALTENEDDMTVTVYNAVEGCKYQIWSYQSITSDLLLDGETFVQANQWILLKPYDEFGQAVGTLAYTIGKFTSPNNNYTIAVRIIDGSGAYVREIRDSYTKTEVGTAEIVKVLVDGEYIRGSSQEDRDNNIKSAAVIKEITEETAPVIQVIGNLSGMTYTATVLETSETLIANGNEFTWDISGLEPRMYTVRVTASKGATTDTWDVSFVLYMSAAPTVPYGVLNSMTLTGGTPYSAPQTININANFGNGYFYYRVGEAGRSPIYTSGELSTGTNTQTIDKYGIYRVLGYANRSTISLSGGYFDDGNAQTIRIKRAAGATTTTLTANVTDLNDVEKGTQIIFSSTATIAGIGTTDVEYSYWRQDAGGYVLVKDWSLDPTLSWTPGRIGNYKIEVRAKGVDAGSYEAINSVRVNVTSTEQIAKNVVFTINKTELNSAQPWTPIVVKVSATSDSADLLYKFNVQDPMFDAVTRQNYSPNQEFVWTPKKAGDYKISVLVKNQDSFGQFDAIEQFTVTVQ